MPDFYQILKREIEPITLLTPTETIKESYVEKKLVDNLTPKQTSFLREKTAAIAPAMKKRRKKTGKKHPKDKPEQKIKLIRVFII